MDNHTIVAVYDTVDHAAAAVRELQGAGIPADAITQHASTAATTTSNATMAPVREQGFWSSLFGGEPEHDTALYDRSIEAGSAVVTVKVPEAQYDHVSAILEKHNPIDLDERAASYGTQTTTTRTDTMGAAPATGTIGAAPAVGVRATTPVAGAPVAGSDRMQLSEETMSIGKRAVQGGTTRIRRYVVEKPVSEQVSLHDEKVTLERHPVTDGRAVNNADFSEKTIEMTESREEAVVGKTARVYEEVGLKREGVDRTETVKDTVRREEVDVQQAGGLGNRPAAVSPVTPIKP